MNMNCKRRFKIAALFAVIAGGIGLAGCRHSSPEARVDKISERIASKLDFNETQKDLLNAIKTEIKADMENEKKYRLAVKDEMQKMIMAPDLDQARLKDLFNERQQRMQVKADKYITKIAELHKSLNLEQKHSIVEKINMFVEHMQ
jgi:outer membrane murein-binding lipoprotein Lpp